MKTYFFSVQGSCRLDEFLRNVLPDAIQKGVSNSKIRRLIISGSVFVSGKKMPIPSFALASGRKVSVCIDEEKLFYEKKPDDIKFELEEKDVLFEDDYIIVVNKPTHFPSEKGMVDSRDNLHECVIRYLWKKNPSLRNPPYVGVMHRLDRDTSGVILFTKSRTVNAACHDMFEKHTAKKVYVAAVTGKITEKSFCVEFLMGRISAKSQGAKWGRVSERDGGLESRTDFSFLCVKDIGGKKISLVECRPFTGRTHQIRVHLSSKNLPILGDVLYGGEKFERIMLHAKSLSFPHPVSGETIEVCAPCPF